MTKIEQRQKQAIVNAYVYRFKALNIKVENKDLEQKLLLLPNDELNKFFSDIMKCNNEQILQALGKMNIAAVDTNKQTKELKQEVMKSLNLQDITEFKNNDLDYFKFKDEDGNVFVVKNLGNDSRELFMSILNNTKIANTQDGKKNASEIFKFLRDKQFIEIGLTNSKEAEEVKHTKEQIAVLREIEKYFPNKEVVNSFEENIFIVKGSTTEEDIILSVNKKDGKYKVETIKQETYGAKEDNKLETVENEKVEIPNEVIIELENNREVAQIIEEGLNNNLDDNAIEQTVMVRLRNNNRYANVHNLSAIVAGIIFRRRQDRLNNGMSNEMGGRQYVYTPAKPTPIITDEAA